MQDYRKLQIWQKAHQITLKVYKLTKSFPADERFGLISQMQRCAVSIPSNIAEGSARGSDADFARFIAIAMGSGAELDYQLLLAHELGYVSEEAHQTTTQELNDLRRMMNAFYRRLK
jgi:four helix bundle protein